VNKLENGLDEQRAEQHLGSKELCSRASVPQKSLAGIANTHPKKPLKAKGVFNDDQRQLDEEKAKPAQWTR